MAIDSAHHHEEPSSPLVCPDCAKVLDGEPNFCPACGADLRGMTGSSDTLDGTGRTVIDGRYRLLEKLGEGGMGSVFKVEHVRMGKIAALKLLRPDQSVDRKLKARFLQEARVVARLSHPNTVQVFDAGELEDGGLFITMEYVAGKDLAWHLKAHGPMGEARVLSICTQVLASLQEAHEAGIVHRDIKPANVMLVRRRTHGDDVVKLVDFGIAKLQEAEGRKSTTGDFVGTPAYMSPEQIRGDAVDARSDLYSLGALAFELLTGRPLYVGPTPISIITQHVDAPAPLVAEVNPAAQVSPRFQQIIATALAKDPKDRFPTAEAMRAAVEAVQGTFSARELELTPGGRTQAVLKDRVLSREDFDRFERRLRTRRAMMPLAAVAALGVLGAGGYGAFMGMSMLETWVAAGPGGSEEVEGNDEVSSATALTPGRPITGTIGAALSAERGDVDLFRATVGEGPARITLTGVPDLNLVLEVFQFQRGEDGERLKRVLFLDDVGASEGERVDSLRLEPGELFIRVQERPFCTEPNRPPRERSRSPYTLLVEPMAGGAAQELEPNDSASTAQLLPPGRALTGFVGRRLEPAVLATVNRPDAPFSAVDFYRVEGEAPAVVVVIPPERGGVEVATADDPRARVVEVNRTPALVELKGGSRARLRLTPGRDTVPGATYLLAAATAEPAGLAAVLDLARLLREQGREESRRAMLTQLAARLSTSPDAAVLAAALQP